MGRSRLIVGAIGIVVGFFVYQYGLFLTLGDLEASLVGLILPDLSAALLSLFGSPALTGAILQLIGGIVAIAGLLVCISWIGSQRVMPPSTRAQRTAELVTQTPDSAPKCKFCGAVMEPDAAFCASCQRAQA
jgi:hypothetical protein